VQNRQLPSAPGNGSVWPAYARCHPERSRFSGEAKDLHLIRPRAQAKLHHYPTPRQNGIRSNQPFLRDLHEIFFANFAFYDFDRKFRQDGSSRNTEEREEKRA
jgi:hypothetical protein